jgi:hypothetical protein
MFFNSHDTHSNALNALFVTPRASFTASPTHHQAHAMSDVEATDAAAYRAALEASRALIDRSETSGIDDALADSLRLWEQENAEQLAGACAIASALCSLRAELCG